MITILLTAIGVGGATVIGALIGFLCKTPSPKFNDAILSFAAGVMLSAAIVGLILSSAEYGGKFSVFVTVFGILCGALCLTAIDKLVPHLHKLTSLEREAHPEKTERLDKVLLFVVAIAIHNLPEGVAASVGFGTENTTRALTVSVGIALQNIPEGMVVIPPMLAAGIGKRRTLLIALGTGLVEVVGTFIGYFAARISAAVLPFGLAFAGGTMLYVVSDEMIPETHAKDNERLATYALLVGFCAMLLFDFFS